MSRDEPAVTSLEGSISPLQSYFDEATGKPRFIALVSPTCGPCLHGATAVRENVVRAFQEVGFPVSLVWIPMLAGDSPSAIERAASDFSHDGIKQFADPERTVGRLVTDSVRDSSGTVKDIYPTVGRLVTDSMGGTAGIAWDIYLFYGPDARWIDGPPEPAEWVHQLGGWSWAPRDRYRCGDELTEELDSLARQMVHQFGDGVRS